VNDAALARSIAAEAGDLLRSIRAASQPGRALGDRGDREANALILARLATERPGEFVLSEESLDDQRRCAASRVWIVDPLDGTRDYAEGLDDWAVHVGLAIDGRPAEGAVAIPMLGRVYCTEHCRAETEPLPARPRMAVSRSRCPDLANWVAAALGADLLPMGSAGAKAMAVVDGRADIYLHAGGQYEWDNCAPAAVALAAGLHVSRVDGSPLVYNCANPLLPDLLICRPELAASVLARIAAA
jgi:3'(2'), 5'-bisphosphate nucleotidase